MGRSPWAIEESGDVGIKSTLPSFLLPPHSLSLPSLLGIVFPASVLAGSSHDQKTIPAGASLLPYQFPAPSYALLLEICCGTLQKLSWLGPDAALDC